jgi:hypothetical protein
VSVTDNHFVRDFSRLKRGTSIFEIAAELSFQDREFVFDDLPSGINNIIEPLGDFLTIYTSSDFIIPGADRDNGISMEVSSDQSMNCFRVISSVYE